MRISWSAQLVAGIVLFGVSLLLEGYVLSTYLGSAALGFSLAAALEVSKALSVVLYRFMRQAGTNAYPPSVSALTVLFRLALVTLSAACSLMFLAERLDRPQLDAVRAADTARVEADTGAALERLERDRERQARTLRETSQRRLEAARTLAAETYRPRIHALEGALRAEMDNTVDGDFIGPRYRELNRRLTREKAALDTRLAQLERGHAEQYGQAQADQEARYTAARVRLQTDRDQRLAAIRLGDYGGDARVEHPMLVALSRVARDVLGVGLPPAVVVFALALFLSVLVELGILVAFETLTLSHLPLFGAEHEVNLSLQRKWVQTRGDLDGLRLDEQALRGRVRHARRRAEARLDEAAAGD